MSISHWGMFFGFMCHEVIGPKGYFGVWLPCDCEESDAWRS